MTSWWWTIIFSKHKKNIFLIVKPTRHTNFSNLFLEWNSTCFGQFLCPSSGVFLCKHSNGICHTDLLTACEQHQNGTLVPSWCCSQAVSKPEWHIPLLCLQRKTLDGGQSVVLFGCYLCCSMYCLFVNVCCHRVTTQLQLINIWYIVS